MLCPISGLCSVSVKMLKYCIFQLPIKFVLISSRCIICYKTFCRILHQGFNNNCPQWTNLSWKVEWQLKITFRLFQPLYSCHQEPDLRMSWGMQPKSEMYDFQHLDNTSCRRALRSISAIGTNPKTATIYMTVVIAVHFISWVLAANQCWRQIKRKNFKKNRRLNDWRNNLTNTTWDRSSTCESQPNKKDQLNRSC